MAVSANADVKKYTKQRTGNYGSDNLNARVGSTRDVLCPIARLRTRGAQPPTIPFSYNPAFASLLQDRPLYFRNTEGSLGMALLQDDGRLVECPPNYRTMISDESGQPSTAHPFSGGREGSHQHDEESQPLLGGNRNKKGAKSLFNVPPATLKVFVAGLVVVVALLVLIVGLEYGYIYANDPAIGIFDPQKRERIRKEWELEASAHHREITKLLRERDTVQREWILENDKLTEFRREVDLERQQWEEEQKEWSDKRCQWEKQRQGWQDEARRWEEQRWEWTGERHKWEEEQQERDRERRRWEEQRQEWDRERQRWKDEHERKEKEERDRQRRTIQWGPLQKDQECLSYGTARYLAHLDHVPPGWDQHAICTETPIRIHQKDLLPTQCRYDNDQIVGIWVVDFGEPACKPWWRDTKDHGCTSRGSGIHRYEAHLEGYLEPNEFAPNWAEMCGTTPHTMFGEAHSSPTECKYWPEIGVYGFWDISDSQCL